jgi:hypothetical protein
VEVLLILISIGPVETAHFQTWHETAGNAVSPPFNVTDPTNGLTFPDLKSAGQLFKPNLIMPEGCPFLSRRLPKCSIIRPTNTQGISTGVVGFLTAMGLFTGQSKKFFATLTELAAEADAAQRD